MNQCYRAAFKATLSLLLWLQGVINCKLLFPEGTTKDIKIGSSRVRQLLADLCVYVYLNKWPVWRRMQQFDDHWQAVVQSDCILCHLSVLMSRCEVTQSTDSRFCDVFSVSSPQHCTNQRFNTSNLPRNRQHDINTDSVSLCGKFLNLNFEHD